MTGRGPAQAGASSTESVKPEGAEILLYVQREAMERN